jgi:hypothetical protein
MQPSHESTYWKRKLAAYLHDSPEKVLSIVDHEQRARRLAGEIPADEMARKDSDWAASAADRLPFPPSGISKTPVSCFRHPLGGSEVKLNEDRLPIGLAEEVSQKSRPIINEDDDPRAAFITTWRFWRNWASAVHPDFALFPAETRLPDHTIWNHLAVTSAMQGCMGGSAKDYWDARSRGQQSAPPDAPSLLIFSIGPVQDFISASRSTRDLWSGSYLLSYLIGHALTRIALDFGPDHVIFPNLCDQPIIDLLLKDEVWGKVSTGDQKLSEAFGFYVGDSIKGLLTPSLPNRFLAVLPSKMVEHPGFASADAYAAHLAAEVQRFLKDEIAAPVAAAAHKLFGERFNHDRFTSQIVKLLEIHWQVLPWPADFDAALELAKPLPADTENFTPRAGLATVQHLAQNGADKRYLRDGLPTQVASAWSAIYAASEWLLDGTKSNRAFQASTTGHSQPTKDNTKDSLNGRDEAVLLVGEESEAKALSARLEAEFEKKNLLKAGEALAAGTLLKRLWPYATLCKRHNFTPQDLRMPNTRSIADSKPSDDDEGQEFPDEDGKYFAILAFDGDEMGKWISGAKTPELKDVLSTQCQAAYPNADLTHRRPLSPSWHLQFSEALGSFAIHAARRIVEAFNGCLIYAGGDDVLAMLPANTALRCAEVLRMAFRGDLALNDALPDLFQIQNAGFLQLKAGRNTRQGASAGLLDDPVTFPAIVPGPAADCSVGVAIAHFKAPLQDVVRAAQAAEKRAKTAQKRSAVAVSLFKRSGEITEWGCRWEQGALPLYREVAALMIDEQLSTKFPHRVCQLLEPYLTQSSQPQAANLATMRSIAQAELAHAIERQGNKDLVPELAPLMTTYLSHFEEVQPMLRSLIGLFTTVAFAHRTQPKGN